MSKIVDLQNEKGKKATKEVGQRITELTEYKGLNFLQALEQYLKEKSL